MGIIGTASVSDAMGLGDGGIAPDGTLIVNSVGYFGTGGEPVRLALASSGRIFVSDAGRKALLIYSNNGLLLNAIHGLIPQGVALDGNGNLYVGDGASGRVFIYDEDGNPLSELGAGSESIGRPSDIATSQNGYVYVVDGKKNEVRAFAVNPPPPEPDFWSDDFEDGVIGPQWELYSLNTGNHTSETGGALNISIPAEAGSARFSGIKLAQLVSGDFDFQVDFSNLARVGANLGGVFFHFEIDGSNKFHILRYDTGANTSLILGRSFVGGVNENNTITSATTSGKLRLQRTGSVVNIYVDTGAGWQLVHSRSGFSTAAGELRLIGRADDSTAVSFDLDNFKDNLVMPVGDFTFGGEVLLAPRGIAVDSSNVYVTDDRGPYVRVFGLNGLYDHWISLSGRVVRPQGVAVDSEWLYIADAYNSAVAVFKKSGEFSQYIGSYGGGSGEFRVPLDACFDLDGKLFVADYNNRRVESIGVGSYINLDISPTVMDFIVNSVDSTPYQDISLTSNVDGTAWTAYVTEQWMQLSATSGAAPSTVRLTINAGGLPDGNYNGYVVFKTGSGVESMVKVSLAVSIQYALFVTPSALEFKYQIGAPLYSTDPYPEASVLVYSSGGSVHWQAQKSVDWLSIPTEGDTPATVTVATNQNVEALERGLYSGTVTFDAGDMEGSPANVPVTLKVVEAGTVEVTTNLDEAEFNLTGEAQYDGKGTYWIYDEVEPGDYRIDFINISGYKKPPSQRFTIHSGEFISINGEYTAKLTDSIVAFSDAGRPDTALIADGQGQVQGQIPVLGGRAAAYAPVTSASGDLDGDGVDEVAFVDVTGYLEVSRPDGSSLISMDIGAGGMISIGMGDVDSDGRADLLVGTRRDGSVSAFGFDADDQWVDKGTVLVTGKGQDIRLASGDIDGDGIDEILVSGRISISAFDIDESGSATMLWSVDNPYGDVSNIASGDLDDDGVDEVVVGAGGNSNNSTFRVLKGDGSGTGVEVEAFGDLGFTSGVTVAVGDLDGDFMDEIIAAPGDSPRNRPLIRIFRGDGSLLDATLDILGQEPGGAVVGAGRYIQ